MKTRLLIVMLITVALTGGGIASWYFLLRPLPFEKPNFDRVGGTILVYELDRQALGNEPVDDMRFANLIVALQRRLDPQDLGLAQVLAAADHCVEIRVPRTSMDHTTLVRRIKDLVPRRGYCEFCVLAHGIDDAEAIAEIAQMVNDLPTKP